jgi:hypothetical protein
MQRPGCPRTSIVDGSVSFEMPLSGDRLVKLTTCQWVVVAALPTITWTAEKHDTVRLSRISVSALHCCRGRNLLATWHAGGGGGGKPISWKHPPSTSANKFKATCIGKKYHGNCLLRPKMCASWLRCNC